MDDNDIILDSRLTEAARMRVMRRPEVRLATDEDL